MDFLTEYPVMDPGAAPTPDADGVPTTLPVDLNMRPAVEHFDARRAQLGDRWGKYVELAGMVAESKRDQETVKSLVDLRSVDTVLEAKRETTLRQEALMQRLAEFEARLGQAPPTMPTDVRMDESEAIAAAIAMITGADPAAVMQGIYQTALGRQERTYQNDLSAYQTAREAAARGYQMAAGDLDEEQAWGRQLEAQGIDSMQAQEQFDRQLEVQARNHALATEKDWRTKFYASTNKGELDLAARQLGLTPESEEYRGALRELGKKEVKQFNDAVMQLWRSASTITPEDAQRLEERAASLAAEYGIPREQLASVPTSETLAKARHEETKKHREELRKIAGEKFKWAKDKHRDDLEARWASIEVARQNMLTARRNSDTNAERLYLGLFHEQTDRLGQKAREKVTELEGTLKGKRKALAEFKVSKLNRKASESHLAKLREEVSVLESQLEGWQKVVSDTNADRAGEGLGPIEDRVETARGMAATTAPPAPSGPRRSPGKDAIRLDWKRTKGKYTPAQRERIKARFRAEFGEEIE